MTWVDVAFTAFGCAGWFAAGLAVATRRQRKPKAVKAICGCKHSLSQHDPKSGRCNVRWFEYKNYKDVEVQCPCLHYVGPKPLPEFYAPEISTDTD